MTAEALPAQSRPSPRAHDIDSESACDRQSAADRRSPRHQRVAAAAAVGFLRAGDGRTRLADLRQQGSAKIMLPRIPGGDAPEAVLLNTAGGVTGGDRLDWSVTVGDGARAVATTQAAERLYRSTGEDSRITTHVTVGAGARLDWAPQETIAFDGARLRRTLEIDMAEDADVSMVEMVTLGRAAMGETVEDLRLLDQRRIRRGGRLVFLDALRLASPVTAMLAGPATGAGARAMATFVHVAPGVEDRLDRARALVDDAGEAVHAGVSAWNGLLCLRAASARPAALRGFIARFHAAYRGPLPRVWRI